MNIDEVIDKIVHADFPDKPDGTKIEDMTKRYIMFHEWQKAETKKLIEEFIQSQDRLLKKREEQLREMAKVLRSQTKSVVYRMQADELLKELINDS